MEVCVAVNQPADAYRMRDNDYIIHLMRGGVSLRHESAAKNVGSRDALFLIGGHASLRAAMEAAREAQAVRPEPGAPRPGAVLRTPNPVFRMKGHVEYLVTIEVANSHPLGAGKVLATAFKNLKSGMYKKYRDGEKLLHGDDFDSARHWARSMRGIGSSLSHASKKHTTIQIYGSNNDPIGNVVATIPADGGLARFSLGDLLRYVGEFL